MQILSVNKLSASPKNLFIVDGFGAFLTALFIGVIMVKYRESFGMPLRVLYVLSIVALLYAIYSFSCSFFIGKNVKPFLKAIIRANIFYQILTIALVIYFYSSLTILAFTYFSLEMIVIASLVILERKVLSKF